MPKIMHVFMKFQNAMQHAASTASILTDLGRDKVLPAPLQQLTSLRNFRTFLTCDRDSLFSL